MDFFNTEASIIKLNSDRTITRNNLVVAVALVGTLKTHALKKCAVGALY